MLAWECLPPPSLLFQAPPLSSISSFLSILATTSGSPTSPIAYVLLPWSSEHLFTDTWPYGALPHSGPGSVPHSHSCPTRLTCSRSTKPQVYDKPNEAKGRICGNSRSWKQATICKHYPLRFEIDQELGNPYFLSM